MTTKLQILGTGCAKCHALTLATEQAAQVLGLSYELEEVTDLTRIMSFGVMMTPALVVDGKVKVIGKVPSASSTGASNPEASPSSSSSAASSSFSAGVAHPYRAMNKIVPRSRMKYDQCN